MFFKQVQASSSKFNLNSFLLQVSVLILFYSLISIPVCNLANAEGEVGGYHLDSKKRAAHQDIVEKATMSLKNYKTNNPDYENYIKRVQTPNTLTVTGNSGRPYKTSNQVKHIFPTLLSSEALTAGGHTLEPKTKNKQVDQFKYGKLRDIQNVAKKRLNPNYVDQKFDVDANAKWKAISDANQEVELKKIEKQKTSLRYKISKFGRSIKSKFIKKQAKI